GLGSWPCNPTYQPSKVAFQDRLTVALDDYPRRTRIRSTSTDQWCCRPNGPLYNASLRASEHLVGKQCSTGSRQHSAADNPWNCCTSHSATDHPDRPPRRASSGPKRGGYTTH